MFTVFSQIQRKLIINMNIKKLFNTDVYLIFVPFLSMTKLILSDF